MGFLVCKMVFSLFEVKQQTPDHPLDYDLLEAFSKQLAENKDVS